MSENIQIKVLRHAKHLIKACRHSISGFKTALQKDTSFRIEITLGIILVPLALALEITIIEKILLIGSWFLVLIIEVINSAIELAVDRISLEIHPISKKIKDLGSAAVLLAAINMATIWVVILINAWS